MRKEVEGKLRMDLIPPHALEAIAEVRDYGITKYESDWEWVYEVSVEDLITACDRHLLQLKYAHSDGHLSEDEESNLPHIWHALTSLAMAVEILGVREQEKLERFKLLASRKTGRK